MMLKTRWIPAAVVVLLLVVGCGAAAEDSTILHANPEPAIESPTLEDNSPVDTQTQRIDELEARLDALQWTEQAAIAVVQSKLRERLVACYSEHGCVLPFGPALLFPPKSGTGRQSDPVLKALPSYPRIFPGQVGALALKRGNGRQSTNLPHLDGE